jgi:hypothetical protein
MASVALADPPRVNDKLQTCPTVYNSGTLVESTLPVFFCIIPDASLDHGVGLSRDISIQQHIILQNATGSEIVFPTRNAWCAFWTHFEFQPVILRGKRRIFLSSSHGCIIWNVFTAHSSFSKSPAVSL